MSIYKEHYNKDIGYDVSIPRKRKILELIHDIKDKKVLDIGCAGGYLGEQLKKRGAHEVVGIDISDVQIEKANEVLDKVFVLDIQEEKTPFQEKYFDIVLFSEVIEHLFNPQKVLMEIKRILKDDGEVVITTPNFLVFSNRIKMLFGKFRYEKEGVFDIGHIRFFSRKSLLEFIEENGFLLADENSITHPKIPFFLGKLFPNLFVFQLIIKIRKK